MPPKKSKKVRKESFSDDNLLKFKEVDQCAICLEIPQGKIGTLKECSHQFCLECIKRWLQVGVACPMCKKTPVTIYSGGVEVKVPPLVDRWAEIREDEERAAQDHLLALELSNREMMFSAPSIGQILRSFISEMVASASPSHPSLSRGIPEFLDFESSRSPERSHESEILYIPKAIQRGLISPLMEELEEMWPTSIESKRSVTKGTRKGMSIDITDPTPIVKRIIDLATKIIIKKIDRIQTNPESAWANLYTKGDDYVPWHQDSYGDHILIISIGSCRKFKSRVIHDPKDTESINFGDGDLIYFNREWNETHQHSLPKTKTSGNRISIVLFW